ncbi:hypothetical protein [Clostridium aciditolerans]|uniref:Uncharacterized protein n=1 Tax=Clostridium aciditolerans TaxID=339861 RepID=A0A934M441_9CLOT|nr:hypothetical protein [Clostridium aciditolerans]MBI6873705.1 hypothetical protein [Clostridium aciditolerans]
MNIYLRAAIIFVVTLLICECIIFVLDKKLAVKNFRLTDKCKYFVESTLCIIMGVISGVFR